MSYNLITGVYNDVCVGTEVSASLCNMWSHHDIILSRISLFSITVEVNRPSYYRDKPKVCTTMYALDTKVPASLKHINTTRF